MTDHYPNSAGFKEPTTSKAAAAAIEASGRGRRLRESVMFYFDCGYEGTADEIARWLGEPALAIRPRVSELHKLEWIEPTGERRRSLAGGASSHVWRRKA